jgi:hypothetical protein
VVFSPPLITFFPFIAVSGAINVDKKIKKSFQTPVYSFQYLYGVFYEKSVLCIKPLWTENNIELAKGQKNLELRIKNLESRGVYALNDGGLFNSLPDFSTSLRFARNDHGVGNGW